MSARTLSQRRAAPTAPVRAGTTTTRKRVKINLTCACQSRELWQATSTRAKAWATQQRHRLLDRRHGQRRPRLSQEAEMTRTRLAKSLEPQKVLEAQVLKQRR